MPVVEMPGRQEDDEVAQEEPQKQAQPVAQVRPRCPFCGTTPCPIGMLATMFPGQAMAAVFCCQACGAVLSVSPISQTIMDRPPETRVILPS